MENRPQSSTIKTTLWFALFVVVALVNFASAARPGGARWLALLLGALAAFFAVRYGRELLARYRASGSTRR